MFVKMMLNIQEESRKQINSYYGIVWNPEPNYSSYCLSEVMYPCKKDVIVYTFSDLADF